MSETCIERARRLSGWPNCSVPDCPNKSCLHLYSDKCWPHTVGQPLNWADGLKRVEREILSRTIERNYLTAYMHVTQIG